MCEAIPEPFPGRDRALLQVIEPLWHFEPSWRVLPTQQIPIVVALNWLVAGRMMR